MKISSREATALLVLLHILLPVLFVTQFSLRRRTLFVRRGSPRRVFAVKH